MPAQLNGLEIKTYNHGPAGLYWFYSDLEARFSADDGDFDFGDNEIWRAWCSWLAPVVGHHGIVPEEHIKNSLEYDLCVSKELKVAIKQNRLEWLQVLEQLFLMPAGLTLSDNPTELKTSKNHQSPATMLAGFCSVCDWLGSSGHFEYDDQPCDGSMR